MGNRGESGGFCDEIGWKRMSLGVEEPGMEEGQPHGKPWGTVVVNRGERWLLGTWRRGMDGGE